MTAADVKEKDQPVLYDLKIPVGCELIDLN